MKLAAPQKNSIELELRYRGEVSKFVEAVAQGAANEIACFGSRGDGKTIGAFGAMIQHAYIHAEAGYPLPVRWMGVTDNFNSHRLKTIPSLSEPIWNGAWRFRDDKHTAYFVAGGTEWVNVDLFGVEDQGAMDRLRMAVHGVWFEEPAPVAVLVQSSGISETAWLVAITSRRLPTHTHVAMMTLNYPDEDHWTWLRFIGKPEEDILPAPGTTYFRVPPGERASAKDRAEWERALAGRPDLLRRLLAGQPGGVMLGEQVAMGFREDLHISPKPIGPIPGEPIILGWDGGHTPTCIIGQEWRGINRIYAALTETRGGTKQLIENQVKPWLSKYALWSMGKHPAQLLHGYDPSMDTDEQADIDKNPVKTIEEMLGGDAQPGPVDWEARRGPLLNVMTGRVVDGTSKLQIDRHGGDMLIKALSGRWHYPQDRLGKISRDLPKKPNHPWEDLGDAFCYWLARLNPAVKVKLPREKPKRALSYAIK